MQITMNIQNPGPPGPKYKDWSGRGGICFPKPFIKALPGYVHLIP